MPVIGIATWVSAAASSPSGRPAPSLPSSTASGNGNAAAQYDKLPRADVATTVTARLCAQSRNSTPDDAVATGTVKIAPMLAFTAAGSCGSADGPMRMTPSAHTALAVLIIVPTLPGLPGWCSAANSEPSPAGRSARSTYADRTIAASPDGPSRSAIRPNNSPDIRATRTPAASCAATIAAAPAWRSRSGATISTSMSAPASTACQTG